MPDEQADWAGECEARAEEAEARVAELQSQLSQFQYALTMLVNAVRPWGNAHGSAIGIAFRRAEELVRTIPPGTFQS